MRSNAPVNTILEPGPFGNILFIEHETFSMLCTKLLCKFAKRVVKQCCIHLPTGFVFVYWPWLPYEKETFRLMNPISCLNIRNWWFIRLGFYEGHFFLGHLETLPEWLSHLREWLTTFKTIQSDSNSPIWCVLQLVNGFIHATNCHCSPLKMLVGPFCRSKSKWVFVFHNLWTHACTSWLGKYPQPKHVVHIMFPCFIFHNCFKI